LEKISYKVPKKSSGQELTLLPDSQRTTSLIAVIAGDEPKIGHSWCPEIRFAGNKNTTQMPQKAKRQTPSLQPYEAKTTST